MFFASDHAPECHVVKKGLLSELYLAWTHRIWGEECVLQRRDLFAKLLA